MGFGLCERRKHGARRRIQDGRMPSRPPSPFETILSRTRAPEPDDAKEETVRVSSTPWFVPETADFNDAGTAAGLADIYKEREEAAVPAPPPRLRSVDPDEIARELDLASCADTAALKQSRRTFAAANHPDRVDPRLRENATTRMMIANRLIDQEIKLRMR
jgi:hypothetical protein